jgi:hypothetical protein
VGFCPPQSCSSSSSIFRLFFFLFADQDPKIEDEDDDEHEHETPASPVFPLSSSWSFVERFPHRQTDDDESTSAIAAENHPTGNFALLDPPRQVRAH